MRKSNNFCSMSPHSHFYLMTFLDLNSILNGKIQVRIPVLSNMAYAYRPKAYVKSFHLYQPFDDTHKYQKLFILNHCVQRTKEFRNILKKHCSFKN